MKISILTVIAASALLLGAVFSRADSANVSASDSAAGIPISKVPLVIDHSGSYYATDNLTGTGGITVSASDVTIDLKGFALTGANATNSGIFAPFETTNLVVRNGRINGWNGHGIYAQPVRNVQVLNVEISSNLFTGLNLGENCLITDCQVHDNDTAGIVTDNNAVIKNCVVRTNLGDGIRVNANSQVLGTSSLDNTGTGIIVGHSCEVRDCVATRNLQSGIYVNQPGCQLIGNTCNSNNPTAFLTAAGIYIFDSNNHVEENHLSDNGNAGIIVAPGYTNNVIVKNVVNGSGTNSYIVPSGNELGPIGVAAAPNGSAMNIAQ